MDADLNDLLISVGKIANEYEIGISILIDNMQYLKNENIRALLFSLHHIQQEQLPISFIGAGLTSMFEKVGKAKPYAERMFTFLELKYPNIN